MQRVIVAPLFVLASLLSWSQEKGILSGGFQSESQFYQSDDKISSDLPDEKIGTNNYFKLDYSIGNFMVGVRYEAYFPPMLGFPQGFEGQGIANRYATFQNDFIKFTVGNFYEQFGSGIILRAYEERLLGIDNSIDGINVHLNPTPGIHLIALAGKQRNFFEFGKGTVRGFDGTIDLNEFFQLKKGPNFRLATSVVSKFEEYTGPSADIKENINAFSGRFSVNATNWDFSTEYVEKDIDPSSTNGYNITRKGRAFLSNIGIYKKGFGLTGTFRRIENMDFRSERDASLTDLWINYIPAETRQHGYLMPNIYPYAVQLLGEIGGQVNASYLIPKKSLIGGPYGTKVSLNYATYSKLKRADEVAATDKFTTDFFQTSDTLLYSDFNIEIERKLSSKVKVTLGYVMIEYNKQEIEGVPSDNVDSSIGTFELLYKMRKRKSLRFELQHLSTKQDNENWAGGVIEFTVAPRWSFFAFDQYNYGGDGKVHFYQTGFSYTKSASRVAFSYGRQRGGLICVGGVCRNVPSATGFNLSLSTSFTQ